MAQRHDARPLVHTQLSRFTCFDCFIHSCDDGSQNELSCHLHHVCARAPARSGKCFISWFYLLVAAVINTQTDVCFGVLMCGWFKRPSPSTAGGARSPGSLHSLVQAWWQTWKLCSETVVPDIVGFFVLSPFRTLASSSPSPLTYQRQRASLLSQGDSEHLEPLPQYVKQFIKEQEV